MSQQSTAPVPLEHKHQIIQGALFGVIFGFLLQKGGVAKYNVLIGALLLEDLTVMKVMLTAIAIGTVGVFFLHSWGLIELHVKPTRYAANILGGLIFGVGFGLLSYCPGTGAAALGQGNFDALAGVAGLMTGSYLFAEFSGYLDRTLLKIGDRGKLQLPMLLGVSNAMFLLFWIPLLVLILIGLNQFSAR